MASPQVTKPRTITPTSQPISILSTDASRTFTHLHPVLLLAYYYVRFPYLVSDPVPTLLKDTIPLVILQCSYAITCLPLNSTTTTSRPKAGKTNTPKRSVVQKPPLGISNKIITALLALALTALAASPVITVLMILLGAPLTTHLPQTYLAACHISLLAAFPLFYVHGVSTQIWWEVGGFMLAFDEVWGATFGTVMGGWLGAIPIPLDWDRAWQAWPITIVTGAYLGHVIGKLAGAYIFKGKRIKIESRS